MRVLVIGTTGYVGSRTIPVLLERGWHVLAGAREPRDLEKFRWYADVTPVTVDALDRESVDAALSMGVDAIVYLVHGMGGDDFRETDRAAAEDVRDLATAHGVKRIVYVSGIIPPIDEDDLSEHLVSRLEVERTLSEAAASVITLRAAMVLGAASTSFELMAQLAERLPITVVPTWMKHDVEPIAIVDLANAVAGAVAADLPTGHFDVGGGERLPYPDLIERFTEAAGAERPQITVPLLPQSLVATLASWISDVPSPTVVALMESLREDMVAAESRWIGTLVPADYVPVTIDDALARSLSTGGNDDPMRMQPGDPKWANAVEEA